MSAFPRHWGKVFTCPINSHCFCVHELLCQSGLSAYLQDQKRIVIKPNLVEAIPHPVTTPVELVEEIILYLKNNTSCEICIAEGTAAMEYDTFHAYDRLGYTVMAARHNVSLIDLNQEQSVTLKRPGCSRWPTMHLPKMIMDSFLISVPILKAHSLAGVTLTLKNMMGIAPPEHYQQGGWKKSAFHHQIQEAVADLNRYRTPDFTILDASVGMAQAHLWGPTCDPPIGLLAASSDPVAIDAYGAQLLNKKWREIGHIESLHRELGLAEPLEILQVVGKH
ncbi:DUF362 domain-containing protein [Desulfogranum japonicum]|uniref:DUF362 domain-containing protein n=1 Tax=Desulfogranum japonicum TaxID=231447 RepID=UPI000684EAC8|nr:DUF362 domain-containing protein [Desulfogranum japonicum]